MNKLCASCKETKSEDHFNWKVKGVRRATYCRICSRAYIRDHYERNQSYYLIKAKIRNKRYIEETHSIIGNYLLHHPCVDCGESDILVLEFDHTDRAKKLSSVGEMARRKLSISKIYAEIDKCDIRCANCHRRKTEKENNSWKLHFAPVA